MGENAYARGRTVMAIGVLGLYLLNTPLSIAADAFVVPWWYYALSGVPVAVYLLYAVAFGSTFNVWQTVLVVVLGFNLFFLYVGARGILSGGIEAAYLLASVHAVPFVAWLGFRYAWWPYRRRADRKRVTY